MNNPVKIAYITETSPDDRHAWSGTAHYVFEALKKNNHDVKALGPDKPKFIGYLCMVLNQLSLKIFKKRFDYRHSTIYSKAFGRIFTKKLKAIEHDIIVVCGGTEYGAYIKTQKPIYIIVDRTIEGALNYHSILTNLWDFSKKQSINTDKKAMMESHKVFFSSQWAANHAKTFYGLPDTKSVVLPFGANMDILPSAEYVFRHKTNTDECKLLLVGTMWKNKGADIAVNALNILLKNGIKAHLTIVGCQPETPINHNHITIIPFLNKNSKEGLKKLEELFLEHSFFILPTRFDCTPIVFCEASAYALPILSSNTGGVAGHVKENINGFLISYEDKGESYAKKVIELWNNKEEYHKLTLSTRALFDKELNWQVWANHFDAAIKQI